jgi:hypothetical protein
MTESNQTPAPELPPPVEYVVTDADVRALRELRPRRLRFPLIEYVLHFAAAALAVLVAALLLLAHRTDLMPVSLGLVFGLWLIAWIYFALFLFHRSPQGDAWFEALRESPLLSTGPCRVEIRNDGLLLHTRLATHRFTPEQLEDGLYEHDHFFIRTVNGQAIVIPRRAFDSEDAWTQFITVVTTKASW